MKIGITIGDPSGIGPEVVLKSLRRFNIPRDCQIFVFGDSIALKKNGFRNNIDRFNLLDLDIIKEREFRFGVLSKRFGLASLVYLKEALKFLKQERINCLVTAPLNKEAISLNRIKFCGHTEFLADEFAIKKFVMMFVSPRLKLSLVTRHIALKDVANAITKEKIFTTLSLTYEALKNYFGISRPKIAVSALNPHGQETGNEEERVIKPTIQEFKYIYKTNEVYGPLSADTILKHGLSQEFDAVIYMYHDQGLIPFKILCFKEGVNLTLGLPFIRTSPVHGTAFDIAGKNKADYHSMLAAIKLAYTLTKNGKQPHGHARGTYMYPPSPNT